MKTRAALATFALFLPTTRNDFVNYDDPDYVTSNPHVSSGLAWPNVTWAFRTSHASNWHPLTWLSHMLDCQLFGQQPWGHHLVNVLFHTANAVLLFLLLRRMTGALGRSAMVAALFALHPLHVESVAWISERKDVLSTLFFLLTIWAYVRYVDKAESRKQKAEIEAAKRGPFCRGRDTGYTVPPSQIPAGGIPAPGSSSQLALAFARRCVPGR